MRSSMGTVGTGTVVSASAYDSMLHRDSRFWDVIAERMEENMRRRKATEESTGMAGVGLRPDVGGGVHEVGNEVNSPFFGPTIGKRRDFVARGTLIVPRWMRLSSGGRAHYRDRDDNGCDGDGDYMSPSANKETPSFGCPVYIERVSLRIGHRGTADEGAESHTQFHVLRKN